MALGEFVNALIEKKAHEAMTRTSFGRDDFGCTRISPAVSACSAARVWENTIT
jgi:hypothetical protein